jgi:hypothetical protein
MRRLLPVRVGRLFLTTMLPRATAARLLENFFPLLYVVFASGWTESDLENDPFVHTALDTARRFRRFANAPSLGVATERGFISVSPQMTEKFS